MVFNSWKDIPTLPEDEQSELENLIGQLLANGKIPTEVSPQMLFAMNRENHKRNVRNTNELRRVWLVLGVLAASTIGIGYLLSQVRIEHLAINTELQRIGLELALHLIGGK